MYHNWLRSFHGVAVQGGFTAASKVLNVGQSTITEQVKALEQQFGVELFHRRGRTVTLTATGQRLVEITQDIFGHEEEAIAFLKGARDLQHGHLKIGGVGAPVVMELAQYFQASYPDILRERGGAARFDAFRQQWLTNDPFGFAAINRMLGDMDMTGDYAKIACPALVVAGEHDGLRPTEAIEAMADAMPNAIYLLADTGHFMHVQTPEMFLELATPFMKGV